jgi:hypothetical protein
MMLTILDDAIPASGRSIALSIAVEMPHSKQRDGIASAFGMRKDRSWIQIVAMQRGMHPLVERL